MFIRRNDAFEFRIGGPFNVRHAGIDVGYSAENDDVATLSGALKLLHKVALTAVALKDGTLQIVFVDGDVLSVAPDPHHEAWEMSGPNGLKIVSLPGGQLAFWSALNTVRGDFNHKDEAGRVRLDTSDAKADIERLGTEIRDGVHVLVYDEGGYQAECVLERVGREWRARILPETGKAW